MEISFVPSILFRNRSAIKYRILDTKTNKEYGYFYLSFSNKSSVLWLDEIYIHEDFRGFGIGTAALNWIIQFAKKFGNSDVQLLVAFENEGAQKLYRRLGFEFLPHISDYCYFMEYAIKENQNGLQI